MTTFVGVIADTHVPQRINSLPDGISRALKDVKLILHCGDINFPRVLQELGRIAPVIAVAGNADPPWLGLPGSRIVIVNGCRIGMTHGHGGWQSYVMDKFRDRLGGWKQSRYLGYAGEAFQGVDVVVTGHTHRPHLKYVGGVLLFNPGTAAPNYYGTGGPTVGRLHIEAGIARAELIQLDTR
jgi:hypothetical protein